MIASEAAVHTWWLEPRDPLVFGDGSRIPALAPRHRFLLPPQGTLAGMVRTRFVAGQADVSKERARDLLEIRIRGPWLARFCGAGQMPELWLPVPADVMAIRNEKEKSETFLPSRLLELGAAEGTLWSGEGLSLPMLIQKAERLKGTKTSRPGFPFWPLDEVVRWSLDPQELTRNFSRSILPEYRVHVGIDDTTWTAEPEALFSSAGLRYGSGFGLVAEVQDRGEGPESPAPVPGDPPHLLILGAESRAASCSVLSGPCFPGFETFRQLYRERVEQLLADDRRLGLRLQLLTVPRPNVRGRPPRCPPRPTRPAAPFGGWQPKWPSELEGRLLAVCLDRFVPVSGWDLQAGGPRGVRRLVPAGTIYLFGPFDAAEEVLALCSKWWGRSLCEDEKGDEGSFLAPPSHDGYGLVLPTPFGLPRSTSHD